MRALPVLTGAAPRGPTVAAPDRDAVLARAGWVRRSMAEPPRLEEILALYRELGFEVHLEPVATDALGADCSRCAPGLAGTRIVYTRRP